MIKNLRASGRVLTADVRVGANQYGGDVSVQVRVDPRDPDVVTALDPLVTLLEGRAKGLLTDAVHNNFLQAAVKEGVAKELDRKVRAAVANHQAQAQRDLEALRLELAGVTRQLAQEKADNTRLRGQISMTG